MGAGRLSKSAKGSEVAPSPGTGGGSDDFERPEGGAAGSVAMLSPAAGPRTGSFSAGTEGVAMVIVGPLAVTGDVERACSGGFGGCTSMDVEGEARAGSGADEAAAGGRDDPVPGFLMTKVFAH